ncbi:MAG: hypothetical protein ACT4P9_15165 [Betaproteobacteria bacterium]
MNRMPVLFIALVLPLAAQAQGKDGKDAAHVKQDVAIHRIIAAAHEAAAKCLEAGKPEKECHAQLAKDCQKHAIGKYCGMRHRH